MTLLSKIYQSNRILLASDDRVSDENGRVRGWKKVKKIVIFKKCNSAIAVAGFLSYNDEFDILEHFSHLSILPISNLDELTTKLLLDLPQIPCDDFKETESIFFLANIKNHSPFKKSIYKNKTDNFILKEAKIPNNFFCKKIDDSLRDLKSTYRIYRPIPSIDYNKLNEIVDFSTNYFNEKLAILVTSIFHIHAHKTYGDEYYSKIKELTEYEMKVFIIGFYEFINETFRQGYRELISIGICNQIACADNNEVKFIFEE